MENAARANIFSRLTNRKFTHQPLGEVKDCKSSRSGNGEGDCNQFRDYLIDHQLISTFKQGQCPAIGDILSTISSLITGDGSIAAKYQCTPKMNTSALDVIFPHQ